MTAYQQLELTFKRLSHIDHINAIMNWDEATMMPLGGGDARSEAMATLREIEHNLLTAPENLELIEKAKADTTLNSWQRANLYWMEKHIVQNTELPVVLVKAIAEASVKSEQAWRQYRSENNWEDFLPHLEKVFNLIKEATIIRAEKSGLSPYDTLIDDYSPGISQQLIDPIFSRLKTELPPLIDQAIEHQKSKSIKIPEGPFDVSKQKILGMELMRAIGFDFNHGRLDTSHHPFCGGVPVDVRITTRYREDSFTSAMLAICHETGHALYEQHLPKEWLHQPVGHALGTAIHESQSLLIEMQACRTQEFMDFLSGKLDAYFDKQAAFEPHNLYLIYTQVNRGFIRVDADELTYPLHVILRYEIEHDLFNERIQINDLPDVWNEKMTEYLGLSTKDNYQDGVMQDVHWPSGAFGYFPAYTLGSLIAAQLFAKAIKAHPNIKTDISNGQFSDLTSWLHQHIHQKGSSVDFETLLKEATGEALNPEYFLQHVKRRYQV